MPENAIASGIIALVIGGLFALLLVYAIAAIASEDQRQEERRG